MDGDVAFASVKAWEATTGKIKWEFKLLSPPWAGLLSTAGNLVFGGTEEGNFFALDAESGKALWDFQLGGAIRANPMSFALDGKQYVAIAAGFAALFLLVCSAVKRIAVVRPRRDHTPTSGLLMQSRASARVWLPDNPNVG